MDCLIRERNGEEEVWYSENYLKYQVELAYQTGLHKGMRVEFHAIEPMDGKAVESLVSEFKRRLNEEYQKAYSNGEVWRKQSKQLCQFEQDERYVSSTCKHCGCNKWMHE